MNKVLVQLCEVHPICKYSVIDLKKGKDSGSKMRSLVLLGTEFFFLTTTYID